MMIKFNHTIIYHDMWYMMGRKLMRSKITGKKR